MPRIPNREVEDDFDDYEEFPIHDDDPRDKHGRRLPAKEHRRERDWEEQRRDKWNRRYRDDR
jgi:hypothetical protein